MKEISEELYESIHSEVDSFNESVPPDMQLSVEQAIKDYYDAKEGFSRNWQNAQSLTIAG